MSTQKPPEDPDSVSITKPDESPKKSVDLAETKEMANYNESFEPNGEETPSFMEKITTFIKNKKYSLNYSKFNSTSNLTKKKRLLEKNQQLLQDNPQLNSLDRDAKIQEDFEDIQFQYQKQKESLTETLEQAKHNYENTEFQFGYRQVCQARKRIAQFGINELEDQAATILTIFQSSIKVEHLLSRFPFETVEEVPEQEFNRYYLRLQKINQKYILPSLSSGEHTEQNLSLHPTLIQYYQMQEKLFSKRLEQATLPAPTPSFIEKLTYFWKNLYEDSQFLVNNLHFQRLLSLGRNTRNLPRAWECTKIAKDMIDDPHQNIYFDLVRELNRVELETKDLISSLNTKVQECIDKSQELLNSYEFEEAMQLIQEMKDSIMQYKMRVLKEQLEDQFEVVKFNEEIYQRYLSSESLFNANDFLNAQKGLSELRQEIDKYDESLVAETLLEKISLLDSKVNKEYQKGLDQLKKDLQAVEKDVIKTLDFEKARKKLQKLREIAESQEYSEYLLIHEDFLKEFIENVRVGDQIEQIEIEIKNDTFGEARSIITSMETQVQEQSKIIFPKLQKKVAAIKKKVDDAIQKENVLIANRITNIHKLIDDELEITQAEQELAELIKRINHTGLVEHKENLGEITEKIQRNKTVHESLQQVQLIFKDGDLKDASKNIAQILKDVSKNMTSKTVYYSETLKNQVLSLQEQIQAALQDGVESLQADFDAVQEQIQQTTNLQPIQNLLANYKIRAIRLGLEDLKSQIESCLMEVIDNTVVLEEKRQLNQKYENQEELAKTLHDISVFGNRVDSLKNIYPHVKKEIKAFLSKIDKESKDRESQLENRLKKILSAEINQLKFETAEKSLQELLTTSKSLGFPAVSAKIEKHLGICASHKGLLLNVVDVEGMVQQAHIMEARQNIAGIITSMHEYKGIIIDPMRKKVDQVKNLIETKRNEEIQSIKSTIDKYVVQIENKQAKSIYASLLEYHDRAKYLEEESLISEIDGCIQLSKLQLDEKFLSQFEEGKKTKKKSPEETKTIIKTFTMDEVAAETAGSEQTAVFTIKRSDYNFLLQTDDTPEFDSIAEKREYKRKKNLIKRTQRIPPPKTSENLNDSLRSSVTRLRLQVYDQQVNRPVKNRALTKCPYCDADQPEANAHFCFFCGQSMG